MTDRPHLILEWIFDIPNQTLTCKITDDLTYISLEGGVLGYTKIYKGTESHVPNKDWDVEKKWISDNYGDIVGIYQPDYTRTTLNRDQSSWDKIIEAPFGVDSQGLYLDHMQRPQDLLEGDDMAKIMSTADGTLYQTPDCGLTIYKRVTVTDVLYNHAGLPIDVVIEHSQPCMMQPKTTGVKISSYDEMLENNVDILVVDMCREGKWPAPPNPNLQKYYIYPTA